MPLRTSTSNFAPRTSYDTDGSDHRADLSCSVEREGCARQECEGEEIRHLVIATQSDRDRRNRQQEPAHTQSHRKASAR